MDSITHLFIGGAIAAAIAPPKHRRAALLAGAALNSLPDLDVLPLMFSDNPVVRMTWHRGATHSLLVLPFVAWALWAWFKRRGGRVAESPRRWFWVFVCTLLAHPLIDACTVYGTQLLWPLPMPPVMWSTLFIVDPALTVPLLLGCVVAWFARERWLAQRALVGALMLAVAYVGWSVLAKGLVEREAARALAGLGLADAPRLTVPMPNTTLHWRVLAMVPGGFLEGRYSLPGPSETIRFSRHRNDADALEAAGKFPAGARLLWFNHHFARAEVLDGQLVLSDLRMGGHPDYPFRFVVAERDGRAWREVPPRQLRWPWQLLVRVLWHRIWHGKDAPGPLSEEEFRQGQAAAGRSGATPATSASK